MKSIIESSVAILFILLAYTIPPTITIGIWYGILYLISLIEYDTLKNLLALVSLVMLLPLVAYIWAIQIPYIDDKLSNI